MAEPSFPEQAVAVLRAARFDPTARPSVEMTSGSFIWDDEACFEFVAVCRHHGCVTYWEPFLFRSSLILRRPDESSRRGWEELQRVCPEWPGFRPERQSESLRAELERQLAAEW